MFRDRTNLYLSYRRTYPHHSRGFGSGTSRFNTLEEEENLIGGGNISIGHDNNENIELMELPPSFLDVGEEIDTHLLEINKQLEKLSALYKKNLLPGFNDRTTDEEEIEKINYTITSKLFQCDNLIKRFEMLKTNEKFKKDDINMIINMQKNYALKIQQISSDFRKLQNNYIKFLKKDEFDSNITSKTSNNLTNSDYNPALDETEELESYSREAIKESSTILQQSSSINDSIIRQREQEITKLAQGVLEVSRIFKEMQNLVIDQGTIVDRIDYNIENTKIELHQASKELTKATTYQKRTQKCKIIMLLSLVVLLLILIVILKPHHHSSSSSDSNSSPPSNNNNNDNNSNNNNDIPDKDKTTVTDVNDEVIPSKKLVNSQVRVDTNTYNLL